MKAEQNGSPLKSALVLLASASILTSAAPCFGQTGYVFTSPALGASHTCAISADGRTKCWGYNQYGQIGDGTTIDKATPVDVTGLRSNVTAITASYYHTCALLSGGEMQCWGRNERGQLGDNTTDNRSTPVDVIGLGSSVTAITAGERHTCALTTDGGVKCWGHNEYGKLGDGTTVDKSTPVDVTDLSSGVTAIAANMLHTCALTTAGGVKCWGNNFYGQLGDGTTIDKSAPVDVVGLGSGVTAITVGNGYTCAILAEGRVKCWGGNLNGRLGDGTTINRHTPVDVPSLGTGVIAITAGWLHTCALTADGTVKCWGAGFFGQLGDGTTINRTSPVDVLGLGTGVTELASYYGHTCAIVAGGRLRCWGYNDSGQLGDCTRTNSSTPTDVLMACTGCGNATIDSGESCDLWNLDSKTCATENGADWTGTLSCNDDCTLDTTQCIGCGDGIINGDEECDGLDLDSNTCASEKGTDWIGTISCNADCTFNTTQCTQCGNGNIDGTEECDLTNLNSKTCTTELGDDFIGTLTCNTDCTFNTTACVLLSCGNESVDNKEECDGTNLGGWTCQKLGFEGGELRCSNSCRLDKTNCFGDAGVDDPEPDGGYDSGSEDVVDGTVDGVPDGDSESGTEPTELQTDQIEKDSGCSCRMAPSSDNSPVRNAFVLIAALCTTIAFRIRRRSYKPNIIRDR